MTLKRRRPGEVSPEGGSGRSGTGSSAVAAAASVAAPLVALAGAAVGLLAVYFVVTALSAAVPVRGPSGAIDKTAALFRERAGYLAYTRIVNGVRAGKEGRKGSLEGGGRKYGAVELLDGGGSNLALSACN